MKAKGSFALAKPLYSGRIQSEATHRNRFLAWHEVVSSAGKSVPVHRFGQVKPLI
ncbi:MAG: hypothetical protein J6A19_14290 [Oscillospiraceae bacterium]|nr:hypothetical protein [Oscillospiraceae bacterium]